MMQKTMTYPIISITDTMRIYNYFHPKMKKKKSASREPANLDSIKKMLILVLSFLTICTVVFTECVDIHVRVFNTDLFFNEILLIIFANFTVSGLYIKRKLL